MSIFSWALPLAAALLGNKKGGQQAPVRPSSSAGTGTTDSEDSEAARLGFLVGLLSTPTAGQHTGYAPSQASLRSRVSPFARVLLQTQPLPGEDHLAYARRTGIIRDEQPRSILSPQQIGGLMYPRNPIEALMGGLFARAVRSGDRGQGSARGASLAVPWLRRTRQQTTTPQTPPTLNTPQMRLPKPEDVARTINLTWGQQQLYRDLLSNLTRPIAQSPFAYQQLAGPYLGYMQRALEGRAGLPEEAYRTALQQSLDTLAAQAADARRMLAEEYARRGLTQSGLLAKALRSVEAARLAGAQDLLSNLAMQGLQARVEAQRLAAQQLPQLYGIQAGALTDVARTWLQQQLAELQRSELAQAMKRQQAEQDMATWEALGTVLGGLIRW